MYFVNYKVGALSPPIQFLDEQHTLLWQLCESFSGGEMAHAEMILAGQFWHHIESRQCRERRTTGRMAVLTS
jgi:hypothetical protein